MKKFLKNVIMTSLICYGTFYDCNTLAQSSSNTYYVLNDTQKKYVTTTITIL